LRGVTLCEISNHLDLRTLRVTRRAGDAKPPLVPAAPSFTSLRRTLPSQILSEAAVAPVDPKAEKVAKEIVEDISKRGKEALVQHCQRLGDIKVPFTFFFSPLPTIFLIIVRKENHSSWAEKKCGSNSSSYHRNNKNSSKDPQKE
jgi:hypothetical protein